MKKKSASRSAFFNVRVLIGLFIILAGVFVALAGLGTFSASASSSLKAQQKHKIINIQGLPPGFDCATIHEKGIDKMENLGAGRIMIACGESLGGSGTADNAFVRLAKKLLPVPGAYGAADVDVITGTDSISHPTQSETYTTANPDNLNQIVVTYNDSRTAPSCYGGTSYSSDGGATFTRLDPNPMCSGHGTNFGDPVVLYNKPTSTFFGIDIASGCGGFGLGSWKSTDGGVTWATAACVHSGSSDDRESGYADNNPSSPFFGRMYVSWNNFAVGGGALQVVRSTDNGGTWSSAVTVVNSFIRNTQITADKVTGDVYIAGMDEGGGGFPHNDTNKIFKSTDGGATWANTYTGAPFPGPGVVACSDNTYFTCMFPDQGGFWRHEGWGEPAAFNGVVHLVYAEHGAGADPGDVFYIRSTDGGVTFGTPFKLNTDSTTRPQWQPNLSVSDAGTLFATWYDARESTSCTKADPAVPCYRMWSRKSNDNGLNWLADDTLSDVVSPLPGQQDPGIVTGYAGDYDYGSAILTKHVTSWDDGRVTISSQSQQDVFTDRELVGFAVTTSDPACNSVINTQPTDFVIHLSDPVDPSTVGPGDFTVNGIPSDGTITSPDGLTITFQFINSPVINQGLQTMHIPAGAFNRASDNDPNFEFTCTFCYAVTPLQVTTTVPPVGGTFSPPAPGDYDYLVNFNQAVDPSSVQDSDLTLTGNAGGSVIGHTLENGNTTIHFTVHFAFGGSVTASIGAAAVTAFGCNSNEAFTGNYTVSGCLPQQYIITAGTNPIVPGTDDTGNHTDDGDTFVALPFAFQLYDQTYNGVNVSSNGRLDLVTANEPGGYITACLPPPSNVGPYDFTIFATWQDLCTDETPGNCNGNTCTGCGVFTSVSGSPPNRIFNIEWRAAPYGSGATGPVDNFEVRLYENDPNLKFEVIYGTLNPAFLPTTLENWVAGVQGNSGAGFFTQDFCNPVDTVPPSNVSKTYEIPPCGSPSPTPTATPTPTSSPPPTPSPTPSEPPPTPSPTATATATATATPTPRPTPTPRSAPTPRPRPTPAPRP